MILFLHRNERRSKEMAENKTVKYAGNSVGVGLGNALAYFGLQWAEYKYGYKFTDPVVAMAMGGAIASVVLLEFGKVGRAVKYVFDRMFPAKYDHPHNEHHDGDK